MKRLLNALAVAALVFLISAAVSAQGDIRSATGLPIPIGAPVIWGQIELRGIGPDEKKPVVTVKLMNNGGLVSTAFANDRGFYYFIARATDGAQLIVSVSGMDVGQLILTSAGGDRYDMAIDWNERTRPAQQLGVISVKDAYISRSSANNSLFDRATAASRAKKTDEAIKLFRQIVESDPQDFVAWTELGSLYFGQKKKSDAEKAYLKAIELKPDFMVALINLGKLHISTEDFVKAVNVLDQAVGADPTSADAFHYLGEAFLGARQGSKAVPILNEAIRLDPIGKSDVHLRLAALYNGANLKDRAAAEYKLFLEKRPDHPDKAAFEKYIKDNSK